MHRIVSSRLFLLAFAHTALIAMVAIVAFHSSLSASRQAVVAALREAIFIETDSLLVQDQLGKLEALDDFAGRISAYDREAVYALMDAHGRHLAGNLASWPGGVSTQSGYTRFTLHDGQRPQAYEGLITALPDGERLLIGRSRDEADAATRDLTRVELIAVGLIVGLTIAAGWLVSRCAFRQIGGIRRVARAAEAGNLSARIPLTAGNRDFRDVCTEVNAMLESIQRRFTARTHAADDLAHNSRTPLMRVRSRLEALLLSPPADPLSRASLEAAIGDVRRVTELFDRLLTISRIDAGEPQTGFKRFSLTECIHALAEFYRPSVELEGHRLLADIEAEISMVGDSRLIAEAVSNLLDNALKHAGMSERVKLALSQDHGMVRIVVADGGAGIPPELRLRALQRFVRLTPNGECDGHGLGLSFVASVVALHAGTLELRDNCPGLRVEMTLPSQPRADAGSEDCRVNCRSPMPEYPAQQGA